MAKFLALIGVLCVVAVSGHSHVRCKRSISIDELANTYPVVQSSSAYPWPAKPVFPPHLPQLPQQLPQLPQLGGAYKYPVQELIPSGELFQEAGRETQTPLEAPLTLIQETVYEAPAVAVEAVMALPSLDMPAQEAAIMEAPLMSVPVPVPESSYEAPVQEPINEAPMIENPKMMLQEKFYKEPIAQGPLRLPVHPMHDSAFLQAAPMMVQEALFEAPRESYQYPRQSEYPFAAPYPLPEAFPLPEAYPIRDAYLPHPQVDSWAKSPALYNDIYNSMASRRPDLSGFHSELFFNGPRAAAPVASAPCGKPSIIVDEITKPLIVEHFQAPVVVDCYQKPIVISHFIPPIINDFYEAPDFVEKAVELDLQSLIAAAQPAPLLSAPAPVLAAPLLSAPLPCY